MLDGIDVSYWQRTISIQDVPSDFVIVKATEGTGYINPCMSSQANETLDTGKLLGFFHFARTGDAYEEADFFCDTIADYIGQAALFLDYEADALNNGSDWACDFCDRVKERTGQTPGIYMSKGVCRSQDWTRAVNSGFYLWAAQYANYDRMGYDHDPWTDSGGWGAWNYPVLYQYSSCGELEEYNGKLDLDLFYGDTEDWVTLFLGKEDVMATKEEVVSGVVGYSNDDGMDFKFWSDEVYQNIWNSGHILTYKNEDVNGTKDLYQLITDAANANGKVDALEAKVDKLIELLENK